MENFKQLQQPFTKYEMSEDLKTVRNIKTKAKALVNEKTNTYRLVNDLGERQTVKSENLKFTNESEVETKKPVLKPTLKKPTLKSGNEKKATKEKKEKKEKKTKKEKSEFVPTEQMINVVKSEGSKSSKMKKLFSMTGSIKNTAALLKTNYAYVYNVIKYEKYPTSKKKK